jgi:hypothetical protein
MRHLLLAALILVALGGSALAQLETLPSQQIPKASTAPPPLARQPSENPNSPSQLPAPQGNTREIPLPEVFRGCWVGSVPQIDTMQPLSPETGRLIWLTKTYTLCYKQAGYDGKWQLTFGESAVADKREVSDERQLIKVKSLSGPDRAELTAYLHFRTRGFAWFGGVARPSTLDELTHLHCNILPGGDLMMVRAAVFVETDGQPYANVTWHTNFFRAGAQPQDAH